MSNLKTRILPLDGLRAISALGVVWIHIWTTFGNPSLRLGGIDLYKAIAILGNGVDFFFVISGFCMYLVLSKINLSFNTYIDFIKKRFKRIAPAFYFSVIIYSFINYPIINKEFVINIFCHLAFLNNFYSYYTISGPFWSIATEWQFYIIIPFFLYGSNRYSLIKSSVFFTLLALCFSAYIIYKNYDFNFWTAQILIRFPEFVVGIVAAYFFISKKKTPQYFNGWKGLLIGLMITYLGRLFMYTEVVKLLGLFGSFLKVLSFLVLSIGFGLILFHLLTQNSMISRSLSSKYCLYLGKISYSIYLWHSLAIYFSHDFIIQLPFGNINPIIAFFIVMGITIIISDISYRLFESFYFKK